MAETESKTSGIHVVVVTPEATALETDAKFVAIPLFDGELGIYPGRGPMIGRLGYGELRIEQEGTPSLRYYVDGGFVQVADNLVSVLTNRSILAEKLDEPKLEAQLVAVRSRKAAGDDDLDIREREEKQARAQLRLSRVKKK